VSITDKILLSKYINYQYFREKQWFNCRVAGYLGKSRIVAYQVQDNGFFDPVIFRKENLVSSEVFIFVDEGRKEIWIWIGEDADVRTRFISSTVATEIRRLYGLTFRVRSADQGHEGTDFWEFLNIIPQEGIGPTKEKEPFELKPPVLKISKKKTSKKSVDKVSKKTIEKRGQLKTKQTSPLTEYIEAKKSLVTTPPCPQCKKGNLIPYSQIVNVTSRKKEVVPFAKWVCSNCNYSPKGNYP